MQKAGAVPAALLYWQFATSLYPGGIQASDNDGHMLKVRNDFAMFVGDDTMLFVSCLKVCDGDYVCDGD